MFQKSKLNQHPEDSLERIIRALRYHKLVLGNICWASVKIS